MPCEQIGLCGGCTFRNLSYDKQIEYKELKVKETLSKFFDANTDFQNIIKSPLIYGYRNKMEFSFGDDKIDGPLNLGMHQKRSFYNILNADNCDLISTEMKDIVKKTLTFFRERNISYFHKKRFTGYLRNLVLRKSYYENKILVNLVTSSWKNENNLELKLLNDYVEYIKVDYVVGILHTINNQTSDAVKCDDIRVLYGKDYLTEKVCDIYFNISPFSFFQTNSLCAEKLYEKVKEFALCDTNVKGNILYDLFCGTGTISQIMSKYFDKVIAVEIVAEAVEKAKENAKLNGIENVEFILCDVNKYIDSFEKNDIIILDPPREGVITKTLNKILLFKPNRIVYVSCKLQSLERDANIILAEGYKMIKVCPVDMFPWTDNVETVCLFVK